MVVLENSVDIAVPQQEAFDYLSDLRNEAAWNPKMRSVQLLTGDPIGIGSKYRARWAGGPETVVEYTRFERPEEWAAVANSKMMTIRFLARVASIPSGSHRTLRRRCNRCQPTSCAPRPPPGKPSFPGLPMTGNWLAD